MVKDIGPLRTTMKNKFITSNVFGCHRDLVQPYIIFLSTNDHGYVSFVVITLVVSSSLGL